jgi:cytidylate kinase
MLVLQLTELARWWRSLPASGGHTRVLALEGRSGAGKTTLAAELAAVAPDSTVVHLDAICPGWDGLAATPGLLVEQLLEPLSTGRPAGYQRWDWDADRAAERQPVEPTGSLLLLEGIGGGARVCAPYVAALLWLDAPASLRRSRALTRDGDIYAPNWQRWADQEQTYLDTERPWQRADLVLDGAAGPTPSGGVCVLVDRR